jgi:hypothetical protein
MRNLIMTAPTNAEAAAERATGVITPSTHVAGAPVSEQPLTSDDPDDEDCDGEGGADEALFQAMQGMSEGPYWEIRNWEKVLEEMPEEGWWETEADIEVKQRAELAEWEDELLEAFHALPTA